MAAELVETNRLWARVVARIQPEWAERAGAHLVKRSYSEPHWDAGRGSATVPERVTLYGLPIVSARPVPYGRVDPGRPRPVHPPRARRAATGRPTTRSSRPTASCSTRCSPSRTGCGAATSSSTTRRCSTSTTSVPADVVVRPGTSTGGGRRSAPRTGPAHLHRAMLVRPDAGDVSPGAYPDVWQQGGVQLPLTYRFDPGTEFDGVTVHIPLPLLAHVHGDDFAWHVPGLREEVVAALIRALPKQLRRSFVRSPRWPPPCCNAWDPLMAPGGHARSRARLPAGRTRAARRPAPRPPARPPH